MSGEVLTSRQVSVRYNPDLPSWQHDANEAYIRDVWRMLKSEGIWGYPLHSAILQKHQGGWTIVRA